MGTPAGGKTSFPTKNSHLREEELGGGEPEQSDPLLAVGEPLLVGEHLLSSTTASPFLTLGVISDMCDIYNIHLI